MCVCTPSKGKSDVVKLFAVTIDGNSFSGRQYTKKKWWK